MSSLKKGVLYLLASSAGQSVLKILFTAVLARLISPEDFGLMATAGIITGFADLFVQFGFGKGLVQMKNITKSDVGTAYTISAILGFTFFILLLVLAPFIASFFDSPDLVGILRILAILFPLKSLNQVQFGLLQKQMRFKALAGRDVISYLIGYGFIGISLAYLDYGIYALVAALMSQAVVNTVLLGMRQKEYPINFTFNKKSYQDLMFFGKNFTLGKIYNYLALKGDYFIVSKMLGAEALGFYSRGYGLMNAPHNLVGNVMNTVLFSEFSRLQEDEQKTYARLKSTYSLVLFLSIPLLPWFFLFADDIVSVLLGPNWNEVVPIFRVLVAGMSFRLLYKVSGSLLRGGGHLIQQRRAQFVYMLLVLLGSFIGSNYSLLYVAVLIDVALIINFLILTHFVILNTKLKWREILRMFLEIIPVTIIVLIISYLSDLGINYYNIPALFSIVISLSIILVLMLLLDLFFPQIAFKGLLKKQAYKILNKNENKK